MTLRPFLPALCALAALTAGCDGDRSVRITSTTTSEDDARGVLKVVDALQCPQTMGSLTRKGSARAGGTVCTYVGRKGTEVSLHLVALDGDAPAEVLKAFETRLSASLPAAVARLRAETDAEKARVQADLAEAETAAADVAAASGDRASVRAPGVAIEADGEDASVRLPGMRIETRGEQASVRIGGFHIDANDSDGSARVRASSGGGDSLSVNARNNAAEIRTTADGEATRASWILTDNRDTESGWRLVGFEARGPVGGPLVVATVRSKDATRGRAFEDAKDLVTLNVGE